MKRVALLGLASAVGACAGPPSPAPAARSTAPTTEGAGEPTAAMPATDQEAAASVAGLLPHPSPTPTKHAHFETDPVRPIALSPDERRLYVANAPDGRLERLSADTLARQASVAVGLEPVALAVRAVPGGTEIWVVNHLSDSVSVVRDDFAGMRVVRTLLVGDEPRDVVFAGPDKSRAFVAAAHRGQNTPGYNAQLITPGIGRSDVWVFDVNNLGGTLEGAPLTVVSTFSDKPRALAASPDGSHVYVSALQSGTQTTVPMIGGAPPSAPTSNVDGVPINGLSDQILKFDGAHWVANDGTVHDDVVPYNLPDKDVFAINATAPVPVQDASWAHVGAVGLSLAVNPATGSLYAGALWSDNFRRFEGDGSASSGESVRGHLAETHVDVLRPGGVVLPRHLNKHINYAACCAEPGNAEARKSLAFPYALAVSRDGAKVFVAGFGSSRVGIYDAAALEADTFVPAEESLVFVSGGGPSGLAVSGKNLFVYTRFDNGVSVVDTLARAETAHATLHTSESHATVVGRPRLYNARASSSHGDSACASCHISGDNDALAWNLGDPAGHVVDDPNPFTDPPNPQTFLEAKQWHPMKGPMLTQSLRGMANHGPMHWRGDRSGARVNGGTNAQPDTGAYDEFEAFRQFDVAFAGLLGRDTIASPEEIGEMAHFALEIMYPPNPVRRLDNSETPEQMAGRSRFFGPVSLNFTPTPHQCNSCHVLDPEGNAGLTEFPGFFGTSGLTMKDLVIQPIKVPNLRGLYERVGKFGAAHTFVNAFPDDGSPHMGDQIRGFGFTHGGNVDTIARFVSETLFAEGPANPTGIPVHAGGTPGPEHRDLESFLLAFPSNHAPIIGQQTTVTAANDAATWPRVELLHARAAAGECEVVAHVGARGFLYVGTGYQSDFSALPPFSVAQLHALASVAPVTFTAVPVGEGRRRGVDRDADGWTDGDERVFGTDPADPSEHP